MATVTNLLLFEETADIAYLCSISTAVRTVGRSHFSRILQRKPGLVSFSPPSQMRGILSRCDEPFPLA